MSRYPFSEYSSKYLERKKPPVFSEAHHKRMTRRYSRIQRDLIRYDEEKKISTTSPRMMTEDDIAYHLSLRKNKKHKNGKPYSADEYSAEVSALRVLFDYCGNMALRQCLINNPTLKPVKKPSRVKSLTKAEFGRIVSVIRNCDLDDFKDVRSCALVSLMLSIGDRTKELRLANLEDLNLQTWEVDILNPKGIDTYAHERYVPVLPFFRSIVIRYLELRLENNPNGSVALFPPTRGNSVYLSDNSFRKLLVPVKEKADLNRLTFQITRKTFGQFYKDLGLGIEKISVLMGHKNTKTTEDIYCRERNDSAAKSVRELWVEEGIDNSESMPDKDEKFDSQIFKECRGWGSNP